MSVMLKPAAFFLLTSILVLTNTTVAFAAAPPLYPDKCPKGSLTGAPPGEVKISPSTSPVEVEKLLNQIVSCPSACYDLVVSLGVNIASLGLDVKTTAPDQCRPENREKPEEDDRGCAEGDNQPRITVKIEEKKLLNVVLIEGRTIGPKSRCDTELSDIVNSALDKFSNKDTKGLAADLERLEDRPSTVPALLGSVAGSQELVRVFNISQEQASQLARDKPNLVTRLNNAIQSGDASTARQVAGELKLNPSLASNAARMQATQPPGRDQAPVSHPPNPSPRSPDTFIEISPNRSITSEDLDRARQAICAIESSCRYNILGPVTRTGDRAYGAYQVMGNNVPSWTRTWCERAMNPQQFLNNTECQERVFEGQFSSYVERYGGIENAVRVWFGGPGALRNPTASDGWLQVPEYLDRFRQHFGNSVPFGGPAIANTAGLNGLGSPFSNVLPYSDSGNNLSFANLFSQNQNQDGQSAPVRATPTEGIFGGFFRNLFHGGSGGLGNGTGSNLQGGNGQSSGGSNLPSQSDSAIIAQPPEVSKGRPIIVSWSSVGTNPSAPCQVVLERESTETVIGQGNEGTKTIKTDTTMPSGTWNFTLRCTTLSDDHLVEDATSVEVQ